jgi:hypothetical protein
VQDETAALSRQARGLDADTAADWLDGFLQELGSAGAPQRQCAAALFSEEHDVRAAIAGYISARESGLECQLAGKKFGLLMAEIRREIASRCPIPRDAPDRAARVQAVASLCADVIDHIVPGASGFEVTLPASRDPWDSAALRVALVSDGKVLFLTFKDYD